MMMMMMERGRMHISEIRICGTNLGYMVSTTCTERASFNKIKQWGIVDPSLKERTTR